MDWCQYCCERTLVNHWFTTRGTKGQINLYLFGPLASWPILPTLGPIDLRFALLPPKFTARLTCTTSQLYNWSERRAGATQVYKALVSPHGRLKRDRQTINRQTYWQRRKGREHIRRVRQGRKKRKKERKKECNITHSMQYQNHYIVPTILLWL